MPDLLVKLQTRRRFGNEIQQRPRSKSIQREVIPFSNQPVNTLLTFVPKPEQD